MDEEVIKAIQRAKDEVDRKLKGHQGELIHHRHAAKEHEEKIEKLKSQINKYERFLRDNGVLK